MDILSHAIAGAAGGLIFGEPIIGALFGMFPDIVLIGPRRKSPPLAYNVTHSLLFMIVIGGIGIACGTYVPLIAIFSHLLLDLPTHGSKWGPPLGFPFSKKRYSYGGEWEWFQGSWWIGLTLTIIWSLLCLLVWYV